MKKENNEKTEDFLRTFSLKPAPPKLKDRILVNAIQRKKSTHVMTPLLWKGLVGCLFLLIIVLAVDAGLSKIQNERYISITGMPKTPPDEATDDWTMLHDILWEPLVSAKDTGKEKFNAFLKKRGKKMRRPEWRESLEKEWE
jgi:hypothetical protein